ESSTPNHSATVCSPSPLVRERETCTSRVTGPGRPTAQAKHISSATPVGAQDMLHHPTHPTHISINSARRPPKTPSPEPDASPTDGPGTEAGDRDPRQPERS
ncbi:hypothetical protein AMECASPLE_014343, partial [Ameca splendens]